MLVVAVAATAPEECQPKGGIHQHQPQYHVIAPMFPGENNATWPGGVNDANGIFRRDGVWHVFHQCDGGPAVRIGARWPWLSTTYSNVYACVCVSLRVRAVAVKAQLVSLACVLLAADLRRARLAAAAGRAPIRTATRPRHGGSTPGGTMTLTSFWPVFAHFLAPPRTRRVLCST